jgi:ABC-type sugar transport system, periplasmic component
MRTHIQSAKLVLLILGAFLLTGCRHAVAAQVKETAAPIKITYWHRMTGSWAKSQEKLIKEFNHSQKKYRIVAKSWGSYQALHDQIATAGKNNHLPVLGQTPYTNIGDYAAQGWLEPLDQFIYHGKNALTRKQIVNINPSFLATGNYDNKQYAMPFAMSTRILYYNQDLLDAYHLEVPKTWSELLATAAKAKAAGLTPIAVDHSPDMELESMAYGANQQLIDDQLHVNIDTNATQKMSQMIIQASQQGLIQLAKSGQYFTNIFDQGNVLFGIGSSAAIPEVLAHAPKMTWNTALLPKYENSSTNALAGSDLVIFKHASKKQQQGAWAFIRFLLKTDNVVQWSQATGYVPVTQTAIDSTKYQKYLQIWPQYDGAIKSIKTSFSSEIFNGYQDYRQDLLMAIDNVEQHPEQLATTLTTLQKQTETIIYNHQQPE